MVNNEEQDKKALGMYLSEIDSFPLLSYEEEIELGKRVSEGDVSAREKLINSNLRLVVAMAIKHSGENVSIEDAIQNGNCGLIIAAEKYDWKRGVRFSTYASWWIRHEMLRQEINTQRTIRLPQNLVEKMMQYRKCVMSFYMEKGRMPTPAEICSKLKISQGMLKRIKGSERNITSLDEKIGDENSLLLNEIIADECSIIPEEECINKENRDDVAASMNGLKEKERMVMNLRYGLDGSECKSYREIGETIGCSGEYVRQLEMKGLIKMRSNIG